MNEMGASPIHATRYDRGACNIGIVHLGYGAFHRAHQAVYVDDYMEETGDLAWGIAAINLRAAEAGAFRTSAAAADGYLLKTTSPEGERHYRLVRSHLTHLDWSAADGRDEAEALLSRPSVHAVTITVTESGYALDADGALDPDDPQIAAEVSGGASATVYAYLAVALDRRAQSINQPISILCSDNIRGNGHKLKRNFLTYLRLTGRNALVEWAEANATFPNSMVDRITPRATDALNAEITRLQPGRALSPIHGETFRQWVLEDHFAGPMPDLTRVGVEVVQDVDPYEEAKIRILNGGHTCLAYLGALAGHQTFDQAMRNPVLRSHFDGYLDNEVLPGLPDLPFDKSTYRDQVAARFENAAIADQLERICMDGYAKTPIFIRPTLAGCLAKGITPTHGYNSVASWYVFARRAAAGVVSIPYHEPNLTVLTPLLAAGAENDFASARALWADLPEKYPDFAPDLIAAIQKMEATWPA